MEEVQDEVNSYLEESRKKVKRRAQTSFKLLLVFNFISMSPNL